MSQTNILLEAGTNELEVVEFYLDEFVPPSTDAPLTAENGQPATPASYRGYYGVNVAKVLEIIRMPKVTELPEVQHPSVLGAFNLRSRIIPLVDLAMWLGKTHPVNEEQPKTIVTEFNNVTTAFMVSGVNRIHRISWEQVEPPNKYVAAVSNNTVIGVVKLEDRIIFLLDLEKVVANLNPKLGLRLDDLGEDWTNKGYRALVADDSALVREMLRDLMEKAGFTVEVVSNGRAAWDRLEDIKQRCEQNGRPVSDFVHVMVSDIEMPVMDGLNLTHRIKTDHVLSNLPVILFSSLITDKLRHKGESVGADDQISKPEVTQLARRAMALIRAREEEAAATR
ncbi:MULTISPECIES: chemotaxis protein [unclassified Desulfovibrio]|uniref:chemotaxis protein n=1 Tax=unclassified Desulfovibrio TaxID=2593640 RepID=UPI002FD89298